MKKDLWLESIFSPVLQEDVDEECVSRLAHKVILVLIGGSLLLTLFALKFSSTRTLVLSAVSCVFFLITYCLLHLRYVRLASILAVSYLLCLAAYAIHTGDGIHDVAITLFPALLLVASLLLSKTMFVVFAALAVIAVTTTGVCEIYGWVDNKYVPFANWTDIVLAAVLTAATAFLIRILVDMLLSLLQRSRESERNYREMFNAVNEAVLIHDAETGTILDVNESMLAMYGYSRDEIPMLTPEAMCVEEEPYTASDALKWLRRATSEGPQLFRWRSRRKNGEVFWTEVNLTATTVGGEGRILAVVRDVTEKIRIEEDLRQNEKMRAIGQLAGGVAHDFNNQLGGILGFAEILRTTTDDPEQVECIDWIIKAADRAASLTGQLLSFARKGAVAHDHVDLNQVVEETMAILKRTVDRRVKISCSRSESIPPVIGDAGQLQNALLNLAINARDAMPDGGTITFSTALAYLDEEYCAAHSHKVAPGDFVKVSITDTGTGIDPETRERIFEPFFTTKREGEGTGMGLAAVFGTVNGHRGAIEVYTEPGHGTTFTVYLPSANPSDAVDDDDPAPLPRAQPGKSIMVIDDEEGLRQVAVRILEDQGYIVHAFDGGASALGFYRERHADVDLVLLDLIMPELSGHQTGQRLRQINPDVRIVVASGYNSTGDVHALIRKDGAYIQKPYKRRELLEAVAAVLG